MPIEYILRLLAERNAGQHPQTHHSENEGHDKQPTNPAEDAELSCHFLFGH